MKPLKQINKVLNKEFGINIERVSDINCFLTRGSLIGIKFILRDGEFNEDFESFKDVKEFTSKLIK